MEFHKGLVLNVAHMDSKLHYSSDVDFVTRQKTPPHPQNALFQEFGSWLDIIYYSSLMMGDILAAWVSWKIRNGQNLRVSLKLSEILGCFPENL